MKFFLLIFLIFFPHISSASCVILLHGLARTKAAMQPLENTLKKKGYQVINVSYPSRQHTIEILAPMAIKPALQKCPQNSNIHFVTHSMGGILVRQYLQHHNIPRLKRVLMLGPPNQGSEVVDKLGHVPGFYFLNGDAGMQLGTRKENLPRQLGPANFELGIIASNRSINWILSSLIPGHDDGKVSIENTKLKGMNAHIIMPTTHTFMMQNPKVIKQVIYYLEHGQFIR